MEFEESRLSVKVGDLVRFVKTGHLATVIDRKPNDIIGCTLKLFVHGDALKDTPSSDGITYMGIEQLQRLAEKVS